MVRKLKDLCSKGHDMRVTRVRTPRGAVVCHQCRKDQAQDWRRRNPNYHRQWRKANPTYDRDWQRDKRRRPIGVS